MARKPFLLSLLGILALLLGDKVGSRGLLPENQSGRSILSFLEGEVFAKGEGDRKNSIKLIHVRGIKRTEEC